ncbi:MAG: peptidoglycan-binding protein [Eubacteriales bacterium]|nr:peptidoglycan-binding protein [Eubacteriales bacterium]
MRKQALTITLCVLLAGALVAVALLAPGALSAWRRMEKELAATPTPTADISSVLLVTADPNNTPTPTALLLKIGVTGDEVTRLQQRLQELGYYAGEVDGQYEQGTADAVKLFQNQHNLIADGIAGSDTRGILYGENALPYVPTPAPTATPSLLQKGDSGDAVKALQQRLKTLGYYSGSVDGDFGGGTQEAVRLFQSQSGLSVDGVCASQTLSLLFSDEAKQVTVTPTPDPSSMPLLVNKTHPVDSSYKPSDLVVLRNVLPSSLVYVKGAEIQGDRTAANALIEMFNAAKADGVIGWQVSAGYRSVSYQQELFDKQVAAYEKEGKSHSQAVSSTKLTVADPGASEHHTGLAFDITVAGTTFKGTEQEKWLAKNCWDYGFVIRYQEDKEKITGFIAECWHIRYVGLVHSVAMRDRNLCLEEYLGETG